VLTQDFIDGLKHALQFTRDQTVKIEDCVNNRDLAGAQKEMAILTGHSINLQAMTAAKAAYELSQVEKE